MHLSSLLCNLGVHGEGGHNTQQELAAQQKQACFQLTAGLGSLALRKAHGGAEQKECWVWKAGRVHVPWVDGPGGTLVFTQRSPPRRPNWSWRNRRSCRSEAAFGSSSSDAWRQGKDGHLGRRVGTGMGRQATGHGHLLSLQAVPVCDSVRGVWSPLGEWGAADGWMVESWMTASA